MSGYASRWDFLYGTFSKDAVLQGEFDRYRESKKGRGAQLFDDAFLAEIEEWRKSLASSLARHNAKLDEAALNFAVQRISDRIIFLRIVEDRGTEQVGQLQALLNGAKVYLRLVTLFNRADAGGRPATTSGCPKRWPGSTSPPSPASCSPG